MTAAQVRRALKAQSDPEKAAFFPHFFKTGPGEYGERDRFYGVTVPQCRAIAKQAREMKRGEIAILLKSPMHEEREVALFILVDEFNRAKTDKAREDVYRFYVRHLRGVNNWDLVDGSAPTIVGGYLEDKDRAQLYTWAESEDLWEPASRCSRRSASSNKRISKTHSRSPSCYATTSKTSSTRPLGGCCARWATATSLRKNAS